MRGQKPIAISLQSVANRVEQRGDDEDQIEQEAMAGGNFRDLYFQIFPKYRTFRIWNRGLSIHCVRQSEERNYRLANFSTEKHRRKMS